jgi:hypothetical protein
MKYVLARHELCALIPRLDRCLDGGGHPHGVSGRGAVILLDNASMPVFVRSSDEYVQWLAANPRGFVTSDVRRGSALLLHRATCRVLARTAGGAPRTPRGDVRICFGDLGTLAALVRDDHGVEPRQCQHCKPGVTQAALQPVSTEILRQRTIDMFPVGYLTLIAIIQGVALELLLNTVLPLLTSRRFGDLQHVIQFSEGFAGLACIIVASYEYLWFTTVMRWAPRFLDTLVPYALGVAEIVPILLIGSFSRWWASMVGLMIAGGLAFRYTILRASPDMFPAKEHIYQDLTRLLRNLGRICFSLAIMGSIALVFVGTRSVTDVLEILLPWSATLATVIMVSASEIGLNSVYAEYGLPRRDSRRLSVQPAARVVRRLGHRPVKMRDLGKWARQDDAEDQSGIVDLETS